MPKAKRKDVQTFVVRGRETRYAPHMDGEQSLALTMAAADDQAPTRWTAAQLAHGVATGQRLPTLLRAPPPLFPAYDLWDLWPVQLADGQVAPIGAGTCWIILAAPRAGDPDDRHDQARMWLFWCEGAGDAAVWHDCGPLLPDGYNPGSREWSGSACYDPATGAITLYFTAAGRRGETARSFEQRLFMAKGRLTSAADALPRVEDLGAPVEMLRGDDDLYVDVRLAPVAPGHIKGLRDPQFVYDEGALYVLFTASDARLAAHYNGAIGLARWADGAFHLLPPLIIAPDLANEMERPHIVRQHGRYYLFWSSHSGIFAPGGPKLTGLFGMVAERLTGPYRPLNGSGVVLANPDDSPRQAYCWQVIDRGTELFDVVSFVDMPGATGQAADAAARRAVFGGTPAPVHHIRLDGDRTTLLAP